MKPRIGISWLLDKELIGSDKRAIAYIESVKIGGGEPVYLPLISTKKEASDLLNGLDGLLLTGGDDLNPNLYHEENLYCEEYSDIRDTSDMILLKCAIKKDIPVLCICRGVQILNVLCGGTLYQDLTVQKPSSVKHRDPEKLVYVSHNINVLANSHLASAIESDTCHFNGWHHQAIKDLGNGLEVIATSDDGLIEAVQLKDAKYIYGVQFHPERYTVESTQDASKLFEAFVNKCR